MLSAPSISSILFFDGIAFLLFPFLFGKFRRWKLLRLHLSRCFLCKCSWLQSGGKAAFGCCKKKCAAAFNRTQHVNACVCMLEGVKTLKWADFVIALRLHIVKQSLFGSANVSAFKGYLHTKQLMCICGIFLIFVAVLWRKYLHNVGFYTGCSSEVSAHIIK